MGEFIADGERDAIDGKRLDLFEILKFTVADAKDADTGVLRVNVHVFIVDQVIYWQQPKH